MANSNANQNLTNNMNSLAGMANSDSTGRPKVTAITFTTQPDGMNSAPGSGTSVLEVTADMNVVPGNYFLHYVHTFADGTTTNAIALFTGNNTSVFNVTVDFEIELPIVNVEASFTIVNAGNVF